MVQVYTSSNTTMPIGRVEDFNNTNPSKVMTRYRILTGQTVGGSIVTGKTSHHTDFSRAIYGDGPYSLLRPNSTSDTLAQHIDLMV